MTQVAEKAKTYKRLGLLLLAGYAVVQLMAFYLYYYPPATAWFWVDALSTLLPQIGGLKEFRKLTIVGDQLALVLATAYLPMLVVGALTFFWEIRFGKGTKNIDRSSVMNAMACIFLLFVIALIHYLVYWNVSLHRNKVEFSQVFIAAISPYLIGFSCAGLMRIWQISNNNRG